VCVRAYMFVIIVVANKVFRVNILFPEKGVFS
jgi:hypothetical protein